MEVEFDPPEAGTKIEVGSVGDENSRSEVNIRHLSILLLSSDCGRQQQVHHHHRRRDWSVVGFVTSADVVDREFDEDERLHINYFRSSSLSVPGVVQCFPQIISVKWFLQIHGNNYCCIELQHQRS